MVDFHENHCRLGKISTSTLFLLLKSGQALTRNQNLFSRIAVKGTKSPINYNCLQCVACISVPLGTLQKRDACARSQGDRVGDRSGPPAFSGPGTQVGSLLQANNTLSWTMAHHIILHGKK